MSSSDERAVIVVNGLWGTKRMGDANFLVSELSKYVALKTVLSEHRQLDMLPSSFTISRLPWLRIHYLAGLVSTSKRELAPYFWLFRAPTCRNLNRVRVLVCALTWIITWRIGLHRDSHEKGIGKEREEHDSCYPDRAEIPRVLLAVNGGSDLLHIFLRTIILAWDRILSINVISTPYRKGIFIRGIREICTFFLKKIQT